MPTNPTSISIKKVERDPNLFVWIMTFIVGGFAIWSVFQNPALRRPLIAIVYIILVIVHILLHWVLGTIASQPRKVFWYIIAQGILAFAISWMSGEIGMVFALFMGLLGEAVGLSGLNRRALLASVYFLMLGAVALAQTSELVSLGWTLLGVIPMILFVVVYVTLYVRQAEAREQAQTLLTELEAAHHQLSEYAAQVEDLTIAAERQRMARELHDTLSQGLAGLILQLEAADAHLTKERPERAQKIVADAMEQARATLADARRAIGDLRSSTDDFDGLEQALEAEVKRFENATGLPCELEIRLNGEPPNSIVQTGLRIVSEALTNVARHAQASHAWVQVDETESQLCLEIRDDGSGFDPEAIEAGHYGLLGMRERARLAGGTLDVVSEKGNGAAIKVCLPLFEGGSHE
ncbi:MAG: sensor histidine kinase [Anaerolineales bacterium]|jgi:NarL family two-component system sensor histidine kinase YdfH